MIIITGGAGFIGSAVAWRLNQKGEKNILIVDRLGLSEKWKNLVSIRYTDYCDKQVFIDRLESGYYGSSIDAIFHMGACSSTTEKNADYLIENNFRYTERIARWHEKHSETRFIYASSAATYGNGEHGYIDFEDDLLYSLRPMNMYGYSKHLFDCMAMRKGWLQHCVGLKFFNVFGPNEYHKSDMRSVVLKAFPSILNSGKIGLFASHRDDYLNGMQCRDFIYIKDAVEMILFFLENPTVNGIFNIGTGIARTWNDIAVSMFTALNKKTCIEYIPIPENIQKNYQYYTRAELNKLRTAGCNHSCMSLESAIHDYLINYVRNEKYLGIE